MTNRPTVLVVEDEHDLAALYQSWLSADYDVRVANTGADALAAVDATVDVALVDRRLPETDGDELLCALHDTNPGLRVALVSGIEPDFDIISLGFDAYVVKPVSRTELHDVVRRLLTRAVYSGEIREFFALASKRAALEAEKSDEELAESAAYDDLVDRIGARRAELDDLLSRFTTEDFVAEFRELNDEVQE
ncbi:HalX domain-containing protein [Salarchaeum sp. JOR-1]|uniref:HalX domain-containing protein n=1 Tax=Salarchaeum sp. JOR-1 TaxID=2599399 RepID=UPI00119879AA|nr:HalX domain-containing protein [Salarchaeum sp. JOR-1]QDX40840.1 response regulator [Salarchaeum sp. JOR-1]